MDVIFTAVKVIMAGIILSGLGAYGYIAKYDKFDINPLATIYTIIVICTFCTVYVRDIIHQYVAGEFDINNVGKLYSNMNIIAGVVSFGVHIIFVRRHIVFINFARPHLYKLLDFLDDNDGRIERGVLKVGIKIFISPTLLEIVLILRSLHFEPDKSLGWTIYTMIPYLIRTVPATTVYGMTLLCAGFIEVMNLRVKKIVDEVNRMSTHKEWLCKTSFHRMQRYCDLSDKIDRLNNVYNIIIDVSDELLNFSSIPWMNSMLCNVVGIMSGCFTQYMSIADSIFNGKEYDYYSVMTDSAFMFISLMEIHTQSGSCAATVDQIRQTGIILSQADTTQADVRLRESFEFFNLRILQRDYKIKPLGLFLVDWSLLHGVFATVTSFLLILIQADLSKRFLQ
ncbi:putative gustatory receptor 94a [Episyrphus balteatus]|uniref:putative gustatory receptor 94a n=1 Tax=Episyrphus balteatus TaxID=286459 RepID=UPI0024850B04|nr:putative gustatory receptor 94a [Episyrphus balteatus]